MNLGKRDMSSGGQCKSAEKPVGIGWVFKSPWEKPKGFSKNLTIES